MSKPGTKLGVAALVVAVACGAMWFTLNRLVAIPQDRTIFVIGFLTAVGLGIGAFVRGTRWYGGVAIRDLARDPTERRRMAEAAASRAVPDAADRVWARCEGWRVPGGSS